MLIDNMSFTGWLLTMTRLITATVTTTTTANTTVTTTAPLAMDILFSQRLFYIVSYIISLCTKGEIVISSRIQLMRVNDR